MVEALCLLDPLFDLIIRNVLGVRRPDDPNPRWSTSAAVTTRAQEWAGKRRFKASEPVGGSKQGGGIEEGSDEMAGR